MVTSHMPIAWLIKIGRHRGLLFRRLVSIDLDGKTLQVPMIKMVDSITVKSAVKKLAPDEFGFSLGVFYAKWGVTKKNVSKNYDLSSIPTHHLNEMINEIREIRHHIPSANELVNLEKQARIEVSLRGNQPKVTKNRFQERVL